jgi:hypothetical protein
VIFWITCAPEAAGAALAAQVVAVRTAIRKCGFDFRPDLKQSITWPQRAATPHLADPCRLSTQSRTRAIGLLRRTAPSGFAWRKRLLALARSLPYPAPASPVDTPSVKHGANP